METDLFPVNINNSLNGCAVKAAVREGHCGFTTKYVQYKDSNGSVGRYIKGSEYDLLIVDYKQMNMPFFLLPTPELEKDR